MSGELSPPPTREQVSRAASPGAAESQKEPPALDNPDCIATLNRQASVIQNICFASQALAALSLDDTATVSAMRLVLAQFREEAGSPSDPVEKLLLDQLVVAHLKVAELYAQAAETPTLEFKQLYAGAAARLLGAICQLVTTLTTYRTGTQRTQRRSTKATRRTLKTAGKNEHSKLGSKDEGGSS
jgi:hypothetical protein